MSTLLGFLIALAIGVLVLLWGVGVSTGDSGDSSSQPATVVAASPVAIYPPRLATSTPTP